jgi:AMP deaminase
MDGGSGVAVVTDAGGEEQACMAPPFTLREFNRDLAEVWRASTGKITRSFAFRRLRMLDVNYEFHTLMNETLELEGTRDDLADFESVTKVDNHIHAAGGFTRAELLNFIKRKAREDGDRVVTSDGKTLVEALAESGIDDPEGITIDKLDVAATASMFHRFDNFNDSYNPFGAKDLRTIFMKSKNVTGGLYFAELIRDVLIARVQQQGNRVAIEPRLSIYGRGGFQEWNALAKWVIDHKVLDVRRGGGGGGAGGSSGNAAAAAADDDDGQLTGHVKWMIQLPRLCNIFMGKSYDSFAGLMKNIFEPMFAATLDPEAHPEIYTFLNHVSAIDCVDDESNHDPLFVSGAARDMPAGEWTDKSNPPYSYWCYHVWANLYTLNRLREARGLNTFAFKPHGGESGPRHHLATCYLLADSVNHGWRLDMEPTLQYLYYLSQVGLGLCPLSNDALFIQMKDSPVGKLHKRGLRVCLGTDDPLQFHNTATPLLEEYTVGGHFFEVRPCLCLCLCLSFFSVSLFCVCLSTYITTFFFSPQHINTRTHTVHGHRQE